MTRSKRWPDPLKAVPIGPRSKSHAWLTGSECGSPPAAFATLRPAAGPLGCVREARGLAGRPAPGAGVW